MRYITLRVLCEGPTERNFITQVLSPHLASFQVFARPEALRPGQYGIVGWDALRRAIQADVGRSRNHEFVTTMIDLYAIGRYPGVEQQSGETPYDRAERIEQKMAEGLPNPRFLPYVQVHEFEALVLVDVTQLPAQFPDGDADTAPNILRASLGDTAPELVNDGPQTAPSKRILAAIPNYNKAVTGPAVTAAIGLPRLRETCPHFNEWITQLERLSAEE